MSTKEDYQKYRVVDADGVPTPDERYKVAIYLEAALYGCPSFFIIRRTRGLEAEVEMLHMSNHRGVRFSTTDSVRLNVLRLTIFNASPEETILVTSSGPDGWKALCEIMYVLSRQAAVRDYHKRHHTLYDDESGLMQKAYQGFMKQGCEEDADVEREIVAALQLIIGPGGRRKIREITSVACTRCGEDYYFMHTILVSPAAQTVWAGDTLCDSCYRDVAP